MGRSLIMIDKKKIQELVNSYDTDNITIGVLGGHSALDVCRGAKKHGFRTIAVCQKGREKTYTKYYKTRDGKGCIDETIVLDKFADITKPEIQEELREKNTVFIHNRYFWVYFDFKDIENNFMVPIYGARGMVKLEERDVPKNQYYLLDKAGIRYPKIFKSPKDIDRLVIVKVNEAIRGYERAFFYAVSFEDYKKKSEEMLKKKMITEEALKNVANARNLLDKAWDVLRKLEVPKPPPVAIPLWLILVIWGIVGLYMRSGRNFLMKEYRPV